MIKRLLALLLGARRAGSGGRDAELYPIVGSSPAHLDEDPYTSWPSPAAGARDTTADVTLLALPADRTPPGSRQPDRPLDEATVATQRLAWPARDLNRTRPVAPAQSDDATMIIGRLKPEDRQPRLSNPNPAGEETIFAPNRGKPRLPTS